MIAKTKSTLLLLLISLLSLCYFETYAQSTDCVGAQGVCSNGAINENSNGSGINDFSNGQGSLGCINQEHQTLWLFVQIEGGNTLGFVIDPIGFDDYDFAVYGPNLTCDNLGNPIRCSWAAGSGNTGMNGSSNDFSENAGGDGFVRWLNVQPGETYYILIDNFSSTNQGFSLNWNGNNNLNCDVVLPCPNVDLGADTAICDGSALTIGTALEGGTTYEWSTGATTSSIDVTASGEYWLAATKDTCTVIDTVFVGLFNTPVVDIGVDTTLCEGATMTIDATNLEATSYLWQDGSTNPVIMVNSPGTYTVEVFNDICSATDDRIVSYDSIPVIDLGNDTVLCDQISFQLNGFNPDAIQYTWQDGSTGSTFNTSGSGTYTVLVENTACSYTDYIEIDYQNSPAYDLGPDASYCEGDNVIIDAFSTTSTSYLWEDGSTGATLDVDSTDTYSVIVSNNTCAAEDSITITFLDYPELELPADTLLCENDTLSLVATSPVATSYVWQDGSAASTFEVVVAGTYHVTSANQFCAVSDTINIEYLFLPVFDLGLDTIMCKGNTYELVVRGQDDNVTYTWQDGSSDSTFTVESQGDYYADVSNQCGTKTDEVFVEYGSCNCDFFMPNAFTPNGDGLNDVYQPIYDCDSLTNFEFSIYNRWGEMVFSSDTPIQGWRSPNEANGGLLDAYAWLMRYTYSWRGKQMFRRENGIFSIIR